MSAFLGQLEAAGLQALLSGLAALESHWNNAGTSIVGVLDRLGQQAHGLAPLPPQPAPVAAASQEIPQGSTYQPPAYPEPASPVTDHAAHVAAARQDTAEARQEASQGHTATE